MCREPDTMIPILACNPEKVVLIGDHKQLQPVVSCPKARKAGLDVSLFKEFSKSAVMLQVQYRMVGGLLHSNLFFNFRTATTTHHFIDGSYRFFSSNAKAGLCLVSIQDAL